MTRRAGPVRPPAYPETRYGPPPLSDFGDRDTRARLSGAALRGFFNLVDRWRLRDEDARVLLGGLSSSVYYEWKKAPETRELAPDQLTRVSYLVGLYKALHVLYGDALADDWIRLPNRNPVFAGRSPLDYLLAGGLPAFDTVRRLLDARRGGG